MTNALAKWPVVLRTMPQCLVERISADASFFRCRAGRTILALGVASTNVYVVLEGRVRVTLTSIAGSDVALRDLRAGELFGELAAIDGQPRSASIVALDDCFLASIPGCRFRDSVCATPDSSLWLARRLVEQVRSLTDRVFEANALKVSARLHCEILRLCALHGGAGSAEIEPAPTHADLAARIGTNREAVTRELGFLHSQGLVTQRGRRIVVHDVAAIRRLVAAVKGEAMEWPEPKLPLDGAAPAVP
jgi:CRP-like cAMP-binding protein